MLTHQALTHRPYKTARQIIRVHKILRLVEQGLNTPMELYPAKIVRLVDEPNYKYSLKALQQKLAEIRPLDLPAELVASKRQLNQLFNWHIKGRSSDRLPELLCGWRKEYGKQLVNVFN